MDAGNLVSTVERFNAMAVSKKIKILVGVTLPLIVSLEMTLRSLPVA